VIETLARQAAALILRLVRRELRNMEKRMLDRLLAAVAALEDATNQESARIDALVAELKANAADPAAVAAIADRIDAVSAKLKSVAAA